MQYKGSKGHSATSDTSAASILKVSKIAIHRAIDNNLSNTAMLFFYMKLMNSLFYLLLFYLHRLSTPGDKR